jgi:hypothetical protein
MGVGFSRLPHVQSPQFGHPRYGFGGEKWRLQPQRGLRGSVSVLLRSSARSVLRSTRILLTCNKSPPSDSPCGLRDITHVQ